MKPYHEWVEDLASSIGSAVDSDDGIAEDDFYHVNGELAWPCHVCEKIVPIGCAIEEFDPDMHYCGGSESCCP